MSESSTSIRGRSERDLTAQMADHDGLVQWVVRRQWLGPVSFGAALQAGRIGLWQALRHYDPTYGTRFSSYAVPAIARRIWREVARATKEPQSVDLLTLDERGTTDPEEILHQAQIAGELDALLATLPARLRAVVIAHQGWDGTPPQTFAALGQAWGVSRQRIHQLHVRALVLLAHPATSRAMRALTNRQERADYQQTLARQRQLVRKGRRGRR